MATVKAADLEVGRIYRDPLSGMHIRILKNLPPRKQRIRLGFLRLSTTIDLPRETAGMYFNAITGLYEELVEFLDDELETLEA